MQTEQKQEGKEKKKGGRPIGYSPKNEKSIQLTIEGDDVVIKLPKKEFSRKLLADLI